MNQHFLYNVLNQIQYFVNRGEREASLAYIGRLSRLLREWMETADGQIISAESECVMLQDYFSLESMRFPERFDFRVENNVRSGEPVYLPAHIIFPLAAHAVEWIMKQTSGQWHICVTLKQDGQLVRCDIHASDAGSTAHFDAGVHLVPQHKKHSSNATSHNS